MYCSKCVCACSAQWVQCDADCRAQSKHLARKKYSKTPVQPFDRQNLHRLSQLHAIEQAAHPASALQCCWHSLGCAGFRSFQHGCCNRRALETPMLTGGERDDCCKPRRKRYRISSVNSINPLFPRSIETGLTSPDSTSGKMSSWNPPMPAFVLVRPLLAPHVSQMPAGSVACVNNNKFDTVMLIEYRLPKQKVHGPVESMLSNSGGTQVTRG